MGVSATLLAQLRSKVDGYLTDTCTVTTISSSSVDSAGHWSNNTSATADVACRILPINRQMLDALIAESEKSRTYYRLIVKYDQALANGDTVTFGGETYEVKQLLKIDHTSQVDKQAIIVKVG